MAQGMLYPVMHTVVPPLAKVIWRPTLEGLHHLPDTGPVIVASNHLSFFDSVVIPVVVPRKVVFLAKSDYFTGTGGEQQDDARGTNEEDAARSGPPVG